MTVIGRMNQVGVQSVEVTKDAAAVNETHIRMLSFGNQTRNDGVKQRRVHCCQRGAIEKVIGAVGENINHKKRSLGSGVVQRRDEVSRTFFKLLRRGQFGKVNPDLKGGEIPAGQRGEMRGNLGLAQAGTRQAFAQHINAEAAGCCLHIGVAW